MARTIPVYTLDLADHTHDPVLHMAAIQQPGVARFRQKLAVARTGGLSVNLVIIGDSRVRSNASRYRNAWPSRLLRRLMGSTPASVGFLPPSQNTLSGITDPDWAGGDNPWTFAGGVNGNNDFGVGLHAVNVPSGGGSATITYFGDRIFVWYVQNPTGPTAATVTLDGTSVGPLDANDAVTIPGKQVQYGTDGQYGHHTLVITPNSGTLILEGVQWYDKDAPFFNLGAVQLVDGSHAGFDASWWTTKPNWSAMFANGDVFMGGGLIVFDTNDIGAGHTPDQFATDVVGIITNMDARLLSSEMSWLAVFLPIPASQVTQQLAYITATKVALSALGVHRTAVLDLAGLRPGRTWGADLSTDGSHPNDAGHLWVADMIAGVIDPIPATTVPSTPPRLLIDAATTPTFRSSWVESFAAIVGTALAYDEATASAVRERRHRVWLDQGTYQCVLTAEHATGRGDFEILLGRYVGNTPTLTSLGSVDTSTPAGPAATTTRLATTAVNDIPGYVPVVIRKTNEANVGRFIQLVIQKIA